MKKLYNWFASWGWVKALMKKPFFAKFLSYEVLIYLFFGVVTTILNLFAFWACDKMLGSRDLASIGSFTLNTALIANIIAWLIAVIFAYLTNKVWVFESRSWRGVTVVRECASFMGARLFTLAIEEIGLYVIYQTLGVNKILTKVILGIIVVIVNYVFSKIFIFKKEGEKSSAGGKKIILMSVILLILLIISGLFAKQYNKTHPHETESTSAADTVMTSGAGDAV